MTATQNKPASLVSALASIQATMPTVHKGETAKVPTKTGGQYTYTFADLADVARVIYPILGDVGLAFIAMPTFREDGKYVLIGELAHESGDSRKGEFALPERGTAQEVGSAITYGRRYLLGCLTGIVTGDQDDDGAAASKRPTQTTNRPDRPVEKPTVTPASLRGEIAAVGKRGNLTPAEIGDDFAAWSEGSLIGEADVDTLTRYRAYLETMVAK